ncbi:hypothetical protein PLEOSDRAFT_154693 [Pleurotus ostreatus PC15]|uniref:Fungal-type protein kinase domain-containing protein n=2 Tax=Pleurotus TaxID=5320 RepID=A0A067NPX2_PLEO1|nr:hypothetical protein CCMSSC00406_0007590 [Pleurotus cornucopiae]KDQ29969.1 hypothetical protein PLEOSDRAFT_154693 [Pleurotus ostreatus PC15]
MSDHTVAGRLKSTPIKPTKPPPLTRREMSTMHLPAGCLVPNSKFCQTSLNVHEKLKDLALDDEILKLAKDVKKSKKTCYKKIEKLLNCISDKIHGKAIRYSLSIALLTMLNVPATICNTAEPIAFRDNNLHTPTHHPNGIETGKPDIVCLLKSVLAILDLDDRKRIPWHLVLSIIEEKQRSDAKKGPAQSAAYIGCGNQSRPDLVGMYGLSVSPYGFQIQYSCPAGLTTSEEFDWINDIVGLFLYVYTLYSPRPDLPSRDPSISLAHTNDIFAAPTWNIDVGNKVHQNCHIVFVGQPWTRMTWVAKAGSDADPTMIKDTYRDVRTRFKEGEMYKILHEHGTVPGFASFEREYEVESTPGFPIAVTVGTLTRRKTRLIMKTCGLPLTKCKNIVDFFKGMYDVLEAHRWMVSERKLLHRDISHANIVVEAEDAPKIKELKGPKRPVFINEVLHGTIKANPMARLIDMDNCAKLDGSKPEEEEDEEHSDEPLRYRTGTPKFIARSVALGELLDGCEFTPMPSLSPEIAAKYQQVYCDDISKLRAFSDANGTTHGGHQSSDLLARYDDDRSLMAADFEHQPRHDAESVYWCIVVFLLLAKPLHSDVVEDNHGLRDIWLSIAEHEIGKTDDKRSSVITLNKWDKWLHKDLAFVSKLMVPLTRQFRPEWALLSPAPDPLHLHEAMQRLILEHVNIWETQKINVELDTVTSRSYPKEERIEKAPGRHYPIHGQILSASSLGKRESHFEAGPEEFAPKRRRKTNRRLPDDPLPPLARSWLALLGPPQPSEHASEDESGAEDEDGTEDEASDGYEDEDDSDYFLY